MVNYSNFSDYSHFVGIDMSKKKFDVAILDINGKKIGYKKFDNYVHGFEDFLNWVFDITGSKEILFTMEHTGIYSRNLWIYLQENDCSLWMESGFQINRASGIKKTKNDKVDAYFIAEYGLTKKHKAKITPFDEQICLLHDLLSNRNRLINALKTLETPLAEMKKHGNKFSIDAMEKVNDEAIKGLKASLKALEKQIEVLITSIPAWKENFDLILSIPGVGKWLASWVIVYTKNFSSEFSARKFASLAGIAPFEYESGTSIKKGDHTSHFSHKFLKGILHLAAMAAIKSDKKMKEYHAKKKKEGKKGFIPMNNVKNKIIQTMFAIINLRKPFDPNFKHKLAA